jgi:hypothetical protein
MGPSYVIKDPWSGGGGGDGSVHQVIRQENALLQIKMPFTICTRLPPQHILRGFRPHKSSDRGWVGEGKRGTVPRTICKYSVRAPCPTSYCVLHIATGHGLQIRREVEILLKQHGAADKGWSSERGRGYSLCLQQALYFYWFK